MQTLITLLTALLGGLGFLLFRKHRENTQLKADKDLTVQEESSKVVDTEVQSVQKDIDDLEESKNEPIEDAEEFWKKHKK